MKFSHVRPDPYSGLRTGLFCFVFPLMLVFGFKALKIARVSWVGFIEGFYNEGKPYFTSVSAMSV